MDDLDRRQQRKMGAALKTLNPMVLDLNDTVDGMLKMLKRLIGEDIELNWRPKTNFYNQGIRKRKRSWAFHRLWHRQAKWRVYQCV